MIKLDEDALICDLAETYKIYDYKQLSPLRVAVFSCGLRDESRIKMKLDGQPATLESLLLAGIIDRLSTLIWFQTKDGQKGKNKPDSMVDQLINKESENDVIIANTGEEFEEMRRELIGGE